MRDWIKSGTKVMRPFITWCVWLLMRLSISAFFFLSKKLMHWRDLVFNWLIMLSKTWRPVIFMTLLLFGEFGIYIPIPNTLMNIEARWPDWAKWTYDFMNFCGFEVVFSKTLKIMRMKQPMMSIFYMIFSTSGFSLVNCN